MPAHSNTVLYTGLASAEEGLPVVADSAARDALFPTPVGDEKVLRKDINAIERYEASSGSWVLASSNPASTPTIEELEIPFFLPNPISATTTIKLGGSNLPRRIGAMTLAFSGAIATDNTNYWSFELQGIRSNGTPWRMTILTTQATGGAAIVANTGLSFASTAWARSLRFLNQPDTLQLVVTKTGVPANLTDGVLSLRYEPDVVPLIVDTFTRADNTTSMGSTEGLNPKPWQVIAFPTGLTQPVFGIKTNGAAIEVASSSRAYAVVDAGVADCSVSAIISDPTAQSLAMCMSTGSPLSDNTKLPNGYIHTQADIRRSDNGTLTVIGSLSPSLAAGDLVTFERTGGVFTVYKNGVKVGSSSVDTTYTSTLHGIRYSSGTVNSPLWTDFRIAA